MVGAISAPSVSGGVFQPSAAAVAAVHADVAGAGATFMARMRSTAADVTTTARNYAGTDAGTASGIASMVETAVV